MRGDRFHHPQKYGGVVMVDHKVSSAENESRLQHRYAVVVQDLYSCWIQSCQTKNTTAQETMKSLRKLASPDQKLGTMPAKMITDIFFFEALLTN